MSTLSSLIPVRQTTIHETKFSLLVERLVQWYPMAFGILEPHDPKVALLRLQSQLSLRGSFCSEIYCALARSYQLDPAEITQWWIRQNDVSLGELYQRLCHEDDMTQRIFNHLYFRQ